MQEKVIKIPFNTEFYIKSQRAVWAYNYKKTERINIFNTIIAIILLIEGVEFDGVKAFSFTLTMGIALSVYMFILWLNILLHRRRLFKIIDESACVYENEQLDCTFTFSDSGLIYQDNDKLFQLKWHTFKGIVIFKDNILLAQKYNNNIAFILSRLELGDLEYQEVYNVLSEKIS